MAKSRHIYPAFVNFIKETISELQSEGQAVKLTGIFYHLAENDMSFYPYRKQAAERLLSIINQSRVDLGQSSLKWYVSQQPPTNDKGVNSIDVVSDVETIAAADPHLIHIKAFNLPPQEKKLVIDTGGIIELGNLIAKQYLIAEKKGL